MQSHSAFFEFQEITKGLSGQPEAQQIHALTLELYFALERATDFQKRGREAEQLAELLKTEFATCIREHQDRAGQATEQLATARAVHHHELEVLRTELRSLQDQNAAFDELCRSLLETILRAAYAEAADDVDPDAITQPLTPVAVPA